MTTQALTRENLYEKLNEGLGGAYERIAYSRVISRLAKARGCHKLLEYEASYIAGIPGFNSCLLARDGFDVTITVNPRDYEDAIHAWELTGLMGPNVHILLDDGTLKLPEKSFDFVWNHLAFEHYPDPTKLVKEMGNLSRDMVMNLTLAPYNLGFILHWIGHTIQRQPWDHGRMSSTTIAAMLKAHSKSGLFYVEDGAADVPPWMDTVDAKIKDSMTYLDTYPEAIRRKWVWCSADPKAQEHPAVRFFWHMEQHMPKWFKVAVGHHLYVASSVKGS